MPKRKKQAQFANPNFVAKDKHGYNVAKGKRLQPDGSTKLMKFYLGSEYEQAKVKKIQIIAEFAKLRLLGTTVWTQEALDRLADQGIVSPRQLNIKQAQAIKLYDEPLDDKEIAQFADPATGLVKPEHAIAAADLDARKAFTRLDVRGKFHTQIVEQARVDPLGTLERLTKLFGWTNKEASQFMFNVQGPLTMQSPIAYDASENFREVEAKVIEGEYEATDTDSESQ